MTTWITWIAIGVTWILLIVAFVTAFHANQNTRRIGERYARSLLAVTIDRDSCLEMIAMVTSSPSRALPEADLVQVDLTAEFYRLMCTRSMFGAAPAGGLLP